MALQMRFAYTGILRLVIATLTVAITGASAYPRQSAKDAQVMVGTSAWSALEQSMHAMHKSMSSVHSTGNDDEDFVRLMLPHHQAAIDMAKAELTYGQDPQMRRLAQEIIADQQSETELMHLWLKQHHGPHSQALPHQ